MEGTIGDFLPRLKRCKITLTHCDMIVMQHACSVGIPLQVIQVSVCVHIIYKISKDPPVFNVYDRHDDYFSRDCMYV